MSLLGDDSLKDEAANADAYGGSALNPIPTLLKCIALYVLALRFAVSKLLSDVVSLNCMITDFAAESCETASPSDYKLSFIGQNCRYEAEPDLPRDHSFGHDCFRVLKKCLEPYIIISKEQAGREIIENIAKHPKASAARRIFSNVCVEVAEQIPYHHFAHVELVQLIAHLAKHPEACEEEYLKNSKVKINQPFPYLLDELREDLHWPDEETTITFVNLHAFAAVLLRYDIYPFNPTLAVWAHMSALEDKDTSSGIVIKEMWIMAAAQFILRSGPTLYEHILFPQEIMAEHCSSWMPGPLYEGKPAFSVQRWRFWRDRYKAVSQDDRKNNESKYTQECKDLARRAAKLMEALDEA